MTDVAVGSNFGLAVLNPSLSLNRFNFHLITETKKKKSTKRYALQVL